ncbi:MAG: restriction endonuclease subunit S [Nitrosomonas sp.]|nr:restriction endonuclease subunit S [Nitrosomonas sp.]
MSFPRYEKYKDSGVEWLGEVPEHWEVKRLKWGLQLLTEKTDQRENPVALENIESWSGRFIQTETLFAGEGIAFEHGDILFGKLRPYLAKVFLADCEGEAIGDFHVMRPTNILYGRFSQYQMLNREFIHIVDSSTFGAKMPRISWDFLSNIVLAVPPIQEQQIITNFLNRETTKIDELIAEQQRLIELLKEKRQAVISHAVTKGLNPDVPMKDSGVEWLGEIPEHWDPKKIGAISSLKGRLGWQGLKAEEYRDHGPYVVSSAHFENHQIDWDACPRVSQERYDIDSNIQLAPNDVLLMKDGAAMGKLAFLESLPGPACLNSHLLLFRPVNADGDDTYFPRFAFYYMQTGYFQEFIKVNGTGATFLGISQEAIARYQIAMPPHSEQIAISTFLDKETAKLDTLTTEAQRAVSLLQERRTALISAAVTGKIKVTNTPEGIHL